MKPKSRLLYHPIITNKRSRFIFLWFLVISGSLGAALWTQFDRTMHMMGLSSVFGPPSGNPILSVMMSWYFHVAMIFAAAVIAAGITAKHVVGPVRRIEDWLLSQEAGRPLKSLRVRTGDKFSRLVDLINQLSSK